MKPLPDGTVPPHQPHCMGCGPDNPAGLRLRMRVLEDRVHGRVRFDRRHEGAPGFVHGGAVATALDELLGTVLLLVGRPAVTATLTVDFRAPLLLQRDVELQAWCEGIDGRKVYLRGEARDAGQLIAEARAMFVAVDLAHFERSGERLPDAWSRWAADGGRDA